MRCLMGLIARRAQGQFVVFPLDRAQVRAVGALAAAPVLAEILPPPAALAAAPAASHEGAPAASPAASAAAPAAPARPAAPVAPVTPPGRPGPGQLEAFLREQLAAVLQRPAAEVDVETPFPQLGLESLEVLRFKNRLEVALGLVLPATVVWKHPTIRALAKRLEDDIGNASMRSL